MNENIEKRNELLAQTVIKGLASRNARCMTIAFLYSDTRC